VGTPGHLPNRRGAPAEAAEIRLNKKAPERLRLRGQFVGVGVRHALFPNGTRFGALAFAGGVLPDATLRGTRMFRSHGGTVLAVTDRDLGVRPLRPVRTLPAGSGAPDVVLTHLQSFVRVCTVTAGTAPASGRPLAARYGSDLLPPWLPLPLQRGDAVFHAAPSRNLWRTLPRSACFPAVGTPLRAPRAVGGLLAGSSRREFRLRSGLRSSNPYPQG